MFRQITLSIPLGLLLAACSPPAPTSKLDEQLASPAALPPDPAAKNCATCHAQAHEQWLLSQHARANRRVDASLDSPAFQPERKLVHGSFVTTMSKAGSNFVFAVSFSNRPAETYVAKAVIGIEPLRQYLVEVPGGRLQTMDVSYDPRSNDWFNAQGDENRQPYEWGHWRNRSMTWNVQCAFCHMTGLQKNYVISNDSYRTTWKAMGISCVQCHSPAEKPATNGCPVAGKPKPSPEIAMDNCASCHARREELTSQFEPGERFNDHYRLTLPDMPTIYYADGQIRDEDFEFGSFQLSKMCNKGVICMDCHNPHSGKLKLPWQNNAVCMQCHAAPGARGAIPIDPATHSHHADTNSGFQCVGCHMPETKYMQRDPRRDHGFTSPDPRLTIDLGIPNACNRCHADKDAKWADEWTTKWYSNRMDRVTRHRAYAISKAWNGDTSVVGDLVKFTATETIPAWRATLLGLLTPWSDRPEVFALMNEVATNTNALVRAAAARGLAGNRLATPTLRALQRDPIRSVRLDATWSDPEVGGMTELQLAEVNAYLANVQDQPAGALRTAELALQRGRNDEAEKWARKAAEWDPSAAPQHALGRILHAVGKSQEGLTAMQRATQLAPQEAGFHFDLALLYAELERGTDAMASLKNAVAADPRFGRAWYNLGLSQASFDQLDDAIKSLQKAGGLLPDSPEPPYARATILMRQDKKAEACAAAELALRIAPNYTPARELIEAIQSGS